MGKWAQLRRLRTLFADRRFYAFAIFCGVNNVAFPVLPAFLPVKARSLVANPRQISLMLALEAGCFSLASWLVGRASDRWGRRAFVAALCCPGSGLGRPSAVGSCGSIAPVGWPTGLAGPARGPGHPRNKGQHEIVHLVTRRQLLTEPFRSQD